jgi:hypothetical protein
MDSGHFLTIIDKYNYFSDKAHFFSDKLHNKVIFFQIIILIIVGVNKFLTYYFIAEVILKPKSH